LSLVQDLPTSPPITKRQASRFEEFVKLNDTKLWVAPKLVFQRSTMEERLKCCNQLKDLVRGGAFTAIAQLATPLAVAWQTTIR